MSAPFVLPRTKIEGLREFIAELVTRVQVTRVEVSGADFPLWVAALGADHFYSWQGASTTHGQWCHINYMAVDNTLITVETYEPVQDWVTYPPRGAGSRPWLFRYVTTEE